MPKFKEIFSEKYYETEYKDQFEIKPRHITNLLNICNFNVRIYWIIGSDDDDLFKNFYQEQFVQPYINTFISKN